MDTQDITDNPENIPESLRTIYVHYNLVMEAEMCVILPSKILIIKVRAMKRMNL